MLYHITTQLFNKSPKSLIYCSPLDWNNFSEGRFYKLFCFKSVFLNGLSQFRILKFETNYCNPVQKIRPCAQCLFQLADDGKRPTTPSSYTLSHFGKIICLDSAREPYAKDDGVVPTIGTERHIRTEKTKKKRIKQ